MSESVSSDNLSSQIDCMCNKNSITINCDKCFQKTLVKIIDQAKSSFQSSICNLLIDKDVSIQTLQNENAKLQEKIKTSSKLLKNSLVNHQQLDLLTSNDSLKHSGNEEVSDFHLYLNKTKCKMIDEQNVNNDADRCDSVNSESSFDIIQENFSNEISCTSIQKEYRSGINNDNSFQENNLIECSPDNEISDIEESKHEQSFCNEKVEQLSGSDNWEGMYLKASAEHSSIIIKYRDIEEKFHKLEELYRNMNEENSCLTSDKKHLEMKLKDNEEETSVLISLYQELDKKYDELKQLHKIALEENGSLKSDYKILEEKLAETNVLCGKAEEKLSEKNTKNKELEEILKQAMEKIALNEDILTKSAQTETIYQQAKQEILILNSRIDALLSSNNSLKSQISTFEAHQAVHLTEISNFNEKYRNLKTECDLLLQENSRCVDDKVKLHDTITTYSSIIAEFLDKFQCTICFEREQNIVFQCGHSACAECAGNLRNCPMCQAVISLKIKLYIS